MDDQDRGMVKELKELRAAVLESAAKAGRKSLFNSLVITTIDAALALKSAEKFYKGEKRIDLNASPAALMKDDKGMIRMWEKAAANPKTLAASVLDPSHIDALDVAYSALDIFLYETLGEDTPPHATSIEGERTLTWLMKMITSPECGEDDLSFAGEFLGTTVMSLKTRHIALELKEHEVYDAHPKWKHRGYEYEPSGPFDCTEARRNCSVELHKFFGRYGNQLEQLAGISKLLKRVNRLYPLAFRDEICDFSEFVEEMLVMPTVVLYEDKAMEVISGDPCVKGTEYTSIWLYEEKKRFLENLRVYLESRVDGAKDCPQAAELWAGALADYISRRESSIFRYYFDETTAKSFVAAANAAARKEWMERRMGRTIQHVPQIAQPPPKQKPRKRGKAGRKLSDIKDEQVVCGVNWLKKRQEKTPADAARYVLNEAKVAKPLWKEGGYEGTAAESSLAQAIRRAIRR